ncbi:MAG: hypothetical protein B6D35_14680 [Candidatus Brocadia sp. UTAMX2]|jgi:hypothetical protein|nr:MAG: hypothetical protein B6D35_14680 [Candidatus Brocadia sp. UTAMX2]
MTGRSANDNDKEKFTVNQHCPVRKLRNKWYQENMRKKYCFEEIFYLAIQQNSVTTRYAGGY